MLVYLGNANCVSLLLSIIRLQAHNDAPTNGIFLSRPENIVSNVTTVKASIAININIFQANDFTL